MNYHPLVIFFASLVLFCLGFLFAYVITRRLYSIKNQMIIDKINNDFNLEKVRFEEQLKSEKMQIENLRAEHAAWQTKFKDQFKILSTDALYHNNQAFLDLAKQTLEQYQIKAQAELDKKHEQINHSLSPIKETLSQFDLKMADLEKSRIEAYASIKTQFQHMSQSQEMLRTETANLVRALRTPHVKGRWGEIQLRRVVEMAGMLDHCDFVEQVSTSSEEGRLRPDLIVKLPGGKSIVVDSKAVVTSYIDASTTDNESEREFKMNEHARHIRARVLELSRKAYWDQFKESPDFVVLFLPGESFFSAALEKDPSLIEQSVDQKVIIATPTTLIALLKAVAYGWKQMALAENARAISELGSELYKRVFDMTNHFEKLGQRLESAVESYNSTVGSLETRVLVTTRKFRDLKISDGDREIAVVDTIDLKTRQLNSLNQSKEE